MNIIMTVRTFVVAATFAAASLTLTSCGDELEPPAQDIGVAAARAGDGQALRAGLQHRARRCCPCPSDAPTGGTLQPA